MPRAGKLENFTGVNDPYEPPRSPEIEINTTDYSPTHSANIIIHYLIKEGFLKDE